VLNIPIFVGWDNKVSFVQSITRELTHVPSFIKNELVSIKPALHYKDQIEIHTRRKHQIYCRIGQLNQKLRIYPSFFNHPPGKLFLLEGTWFKAERQNVSK
jgi:hypothetical protein